MTEVLDNVGATWARAGVASAPDGLRWRIFVPGGLDPVARARASGRCAISAGLFETGPDGIERLVRSAHVPMRDYDDRRMLFRLRRLAVRLPRLRHRDLEHGLTIEPTPLEWPQDSTSSFLARAARGIGVESELLPIAARAVLRGTAFLRYQAQNLSTYDRWKIGVVRAPIHRFLDPLFRPHVEWFSVEGDQRYAADPHAMPVRVFEPDGEPGAVRVFYEHFDYDAPVGRIDAIDWSPTHGFGAPTQVIETGKHLSYPMLFEYDGATWMAPENAVTNRLTAYRWDGAAWVDPRVLLDGFAALDASLIEHDGRWWLLATDAREEPVHALHAWHAPTPLGPFTPHPGNPLLLDPRSGRPGGSMFHHEGRLYRAAQDCSQTYGGAVVIAEITTLSPTSFGQRVVRRVGPEAIGGAAGLHTMTACGDLTLLDAKDATAVPSETRRRLLGRIGLGR